MESELEDNSMTECAGLPLGVKTGWLGGWSWWLYGLGPTGEETKNGLKTEEGIGDCSCDHLDNKEEGGSSARWLNMGPGLPDGGGGVSTSSSPDHSSSDHWTEEREWLEEGG